MDQMPLVTVTALCFNHEKYVIECVESIVNQSWQNMELILIDNGSSDNSVATIKKWLEENSLPNVRFISNPENIGVCPGFNQGLQLAENNKYHAFISTDDVMESDRIERQVAVFEQDTEEKIGIVMSDMIIINENSEVIPGTYLENIKFDKYPSEKNFYGLLESNFVSTPSVLLRQSAIDKVGMFDEKLSYEDWDMYLRIANNYTVYTIREPLTRYRKLSTSLVSSRIKGNLRFLETDYELLEKWVDYDTRAHKILEKKLLHLILNSFYRFDKAIAKSYLKKYWKHFTTKNLGTMFVSGGIPFIFYFPILKIKKIMS